MVHTRQLQRTMSAPGVPQKHNLCVPSLGRTRPGQEGAAFHSQVGALTRPGLEGAASHSRVRVLSHPGLEGAAFHFWVGALTCPGQEDVASHSRVGALSHPGLEGAAFHFWVGALTCPGQEDAASHCRVGALSRPGQEGAASHSRVGALSRPGLEGAASHSRIGAPGALRADRDGRVLGRSAPAVQLPDSGTGPAIAVASAQREVRDEHARRDAASGCLVGPWTPTRAAQIFTEHGGLAGFSGRLLWGRVCSHRQQSLSKPYPQLPLQQLGSRPTPTGAVTATGRSRTLLLVSDLDTQPHPLARRQWPGRSEERCLLVSVMPDV